MKKQCISVAAMMLFLLPTSGAIAQGTSDSLTPDACLTLVEQYGAPENDPALTFQGGSRAAEQVAFCQSLAFVAARQGTELAQIFATRADLDDDGVVDGGEMTAYFAAARNVAGAPTLLPDSATPEPVETSAGPVATDTAGSRSETREGERLLRLPIVAGAALALLALAVAAIGWRRSRRP